MSAKKVDIINMLLSRKMVKLAEAAAPGDVIARLRGTMAFAYQEMHRVLDEAGLFLTHDEVTEFKYFGNLFNTVLLELWHVDRKWVWRQRPKHHQLEHMILTLETVSRLNPKKTSCLMEEDMIGKTKILGKSARGCSPLHCSIWHCGGTSECCKYSDCHHVYHIGAGSQYALTCIIYTGTHLPMYARLHYACPVLYIDGGDGDNLELHGHDAENLT